MSTEERIPLQSVIDRKISPVMEVRNPLEQIDAEMNQDLLTEYRTKKVMVRLKDLDDRLNTPSKNQPAQPNGHPVANGTYQVPPELVLQLAQMEPEQAERALEYYKQLYAAQTAGQNPAILPYILGPKPNGHSSSEDTVKGYVDMFTTGANLASKAVPQAPNYNPADFLNTAINLVKQNQPVPAAPKDPAEEMKSYLELFDRFGIIKKGDEKPEVTDNALLLELEKHRDDRQLRELEIHERFGVEHEKNKVELEKAQMYGNIFEQVGGAIGRGFADANILGDEVPPARGFPAQQQAQEPSYPPVDTPDLWHRQCSDCAAKGVVTWIPIPNPSEPRASLTCPTCGASGPWPPESAPAPAQAPVPPKYPEYRYDPTRPIR